MKRVSVWSVVKVRNAGIRRRQMEAGLVGPDQGQGLRVGDSDLVEKDGVDASVDGRRIRPRPNVLSKYDRGVTPGFFSCHDRRNIRCRK